MKRMTAKQVKASSRMLVEMNEADRLRKLKEEAKNDLESYVFSTRSKIREHEEILSEVSTDEEREKIMEDLEGIEDWLYEDGADADLSTYKERRSNMDKRVNSLFRRHTELQARPKAVAACKAVLTSTEQVLELWPEERPQISEEEIGEVRDVMKEVADWLTEKEAEQEGKSNVESPAFT